MKRISIIVIVIAGGFGLTGCFSQAAQNAPNSAVLECTSATGTFQTDKTTAIANGFDSSTTVYCDVAK